VKRDDFKIFDESHNVGNTKYRAALVIARGKWEVIMRDDRFDREAVQEFDDEDEARAFFRLIAHEPGSLGAV
jgi:hypothetical protein